MTTMRTLAAALLLQALAPCQGLIVPTQLVQPIPTGPAVTSGLLSVRIEVRDGAATTTLRVGAVSPQRKRSTRCRSSWGERQTSTAGTPS